MELGGLQCHGCGSSNVVFNSKKRILICNQCGKEEYYSRATLNSNGKVMFSKENALNFFTEGKFDNAQHYALDILNIFKDHVPALYMIAYYDEFVMRKEGALKSFFREIKEISLEYDEVQDIKKLILASAYNMIDYEREVIELVSINMQSKEDEADLCEFVDKLCPYLISRRASMDFLTNHLIDLYKELARHCDIPKTCFALLKGIDDNPDSPYVNKCFYLHAKARYFYDHYILPVGTIIDAMRTRDIKEKFIASYRKKKAKYEEDANL